MPRGVKLIVILGLLLGALPLWAQQRSPVHLRVVPANGSLAQGASRSFFFQKLNPVGRGKPTLLTGGAWSSSNRSFATVNPGSGLVHAVAQGVVTITVRSGPFTASTTVRITAVALVSISVTPADAAVAASATPQYAAIGHYSDGTTVDLSSTVTWASSNPAVASIVAGGLATASATTDGNTLISAQDPTSKITGMTGLNVGLTSLSITPLNAQIGQGESEPFTARGVFADAVTRDVSNTVAWSSSAPVATISALGVARGLAAGSTNINAVAGAVSAAAKATLKVVAPPTLVTVQVQPNAPTVSIGSAQMLTASGVFSDGSSRPLSNVLWFSSDPPVAAVDAVGVVRGVVAGMARVTAISGVVSGATQVTVAPPPTLVSIAVTPPSVILAGGVSQQFTATGTYSDSSMADITAQVAWSSSVPVVAVISPAGEATAVGPGTTSITAALSGKAGSATLTSNAVPRFAYVANQFDNSISIFTVNNTSGQLRGAGYVPEGIRPYRMASDPAGRFLLVANVNQGVSSFAIDQKTARIALAPGSPFPAGVNPLSVAIDPTGSYAYVANQSGSGISAYSINQSTGVLTQLSGSPFVAGGDAVWITVAPNGKFVFVADFGKGIYAYKVGSGGALTLVAGSPFAAGVLPGPSAVAVDPTTSFVYVSNQQGNTVSAFTIAPNTGALTAAGGDLATGLTPYSVTVDGAGKFVYTADFNDNTVGAFAIQPSGALVKVAGSPFTAGANPFDVKGDPAGKFLFVMNNGEVWTEQIDPASGALSLLWKARTRGGDYSLALANGAEPVNYQPKFLYTANFSAHDVSGFLVDPQSGLLQPTLPATFPAGTQPHAVVADPLGRFLYVGNLLDGTISSYAVDPFAGTLTPTAQGTVPAAAPFGLAIDSAGRFLYAAGGSMVSGFTVDASTGELTPTNPATVSLAVPSGSPTYVAVDESGRFLYAAGYLGNSVVGAVYAFSINSITGALAPVTSSPFADLSGGPYGVTTDPTGQFVFTTALTPSHTIDGFTANIGSGALTPTTPVSFGLNGGQSPFALAVDPTGRFAYSANFSTNDITGFQIDPSNGNLVPVAATNFAAGLNPYATAVDPSGSFVYAANFNSNSVSAYQLNTADGTLTPLLPATFTTDVAPLSLAITTTLTPLAAHELFLTVAPTGLTLPQGVSQKFTATATLSDGSMQDVSEVVTWTSSDPTIATIDASGNAVGVAPGVVSISATQGQLSGSAALTITDLALQSLTVDPPSPSLPQGAALQFIATGTFSDGTAQDLTSSVLWSSSNPAGLSITAAGKATALMNSGASTVTASSGLVIGNTTLTLTAASALSSIAVQPASATISLGTSQQFKAIGTYTPSNTTQDITASVTWSSSAPAVATISNVSGSQGLASSVGAGPSNITATLGAVSSNPATLTVQAPQLVSLALKPQNAVIAPGHVLPYTATGTFSDGSSSDETALVTWRTSNPSVATISNAVGSKGMATGVGFGPCTISAALNGVTASTPLTGIF